MQAAINKRTLTEQYYGRVHRGRRCFVGGWTRNHNIFLILHSWLEIYSMKIENSDLQLKYIPIPVFSWFPRHLQIFIQFYSDSKLHQGGDKESPAMDGGGY